VGSAHRILLILIYCNSVGFGATGGIVFLYKNSLTNLYFGFIIQAETETDFCFVIEYGFRSRNALSFLLFYFRLEAFYYECVVSRPDTKT